MWWHHDGEDGDAADEFVADGDSGAASEDDDEGVGDGVLIRSVEERG